MKPLDPIKAAQAVQAIKTSLAALGEGDDLQLVLDTVEGETEFFEVVDLLLEEIDGDLAMAGSLAERINRLSARKERFTKRAATTKALLEQAFVVADLPKVERPGGTLYLSNRAPKVVIETESDIPAKFWKPADPVLDRKALGDELKERRAALETVLDADDEEVEAKADAFCQRFLDDHEAAEFRAAIAHRTSDEGRATIRTTFAAVAGAELVDSTPSLSIRSA